jgi:hypothetical protein
LAEGSDPTEQYRDGLAAYRSVAKWVVSSFAAIAAALVAAVQLTSLGELHHSRLILSFVSLGVAFGFILLIIGIAARLLAPMLVNYKKFETSRDFKPLRAYLKDDTRPLGDPSEGIKTAGELAKRYDDALVRFANATVAWRTSPSDENKEELGKATAARDTYRKRIARVTWLGRYLRGSQMYRQTMVMTYVCVAIVAAAAVAFAYLSSPPATSGSAAEQAIHVSVGGPRLLDWPRSCARLYFALGKLAQDQPRVGPLWPPGSLSDWDRVCGLRSRADVARAMAFLGHR